MVYGLPTHIPTRTEILWPYTRSFQFHVYQVQQKKKNDIKNQKARRQRNKITETNGPFYVSNFE